MDRRGLLRMDRGGILRKGRGGREGGLSRGGKRVPPIDNIFCQIREIEEALMRSPGPEILPTPPAVLHTQLENSAFLRTATYFIFSSFSSIIFIYLAFSLCLARLCIAIGAFSSVQHTMAIGAFSQSLPWLYIAVAFSRSFARLKQFCFLSFLSTDIGIWLSFSPQLGYIAQWLSLGPKHVYSNLAFSLS